MTPLLPAPATAAAGTLDLERVVGRRGPRMQAASTHAIYRRAQRALESVGPVFLGMACFTPLGAAYFGLRFPGPAEAGG